MHKTRIAALLLLLLCCGAALAQGPRAALRIEDLRCEYLKDPLGIDVARPRLSWILQSDQRGQKQTACQVLVASTPEQLAKDQGDRWDSGKVPSDRSVQVVYDGAPLTSRNRSYWKVRVWDKDGRASAWSAPASWSMGLLEAADWSAPWIHAGPEKGTVPDKAAETAPSPWFRKTFTLDAVPERASAYVNAVGYCECYVNGRKVGPAVLGPAVCDYRRRSFYTTYDIGPQLHKGNNCIAFWLGQGWHSAERPGVQIAGPAVRAQVEIAAGGHTTRVATDATWKWSPSPYCTLGKWWWNLFGGERYDARLEQPGWNTAEFDDRPWAAASVIPPPVMQAESQMCPPNHVGERIACVRSTDLGKGLNELDFGTDLTGWLRLHVPPLPAGRRVVIHYADKRYTGLAAEATPAGTIEGAMSDEQFLGGSGKLRYQTFNQADEFISAGRPGEEFCSKFNYHGFRYAIIEGLPARPAPADAEALLVESDLEPVGRFECSNELLNRIHRMNLWTLRCLDLGGYLVDCPHRERLGYGDGQVSAEGCLMNFWMPNFYGKWLRDWRDGQHPQSGEMPYVAPDDKTGGGPAWGGGMAAIMWRTYLFYDDRRVLEDGCDSLRRYVDYLEGRCQGGILRFYRGPWYFIGDWVAPDRGMDKPDNWPGKPAEELFNNCYRLYLWQLLEKTNAALGRGDEARRCREHIERIGPLVHREFYDAARHVYRPEEQAYQVLPLVAGVTPAAERGRVLRGLEDLILVRRQGHLDTGMLGTYFLLQHLQASGRNDLAFTIVNQRTYPGWGYMLDQGATTNWEQWNGYWSQIHSCFTSVGGWFYGGLAGIRPDPAAPGFKRIIIRPGVVGDVQWVKAAFRSIHGPIECNWRRHDGRFTLEVAIPVNTTATVYVPAKDPVAVTEGGRGRDRVEGVKLLRTEEGCAVFAIGSGNYRFGSVVR